MSDLPDEVQDLVDWVDAPAGPERDQFFALLRNLRKLILTEVRERADFAVTVQSRSEEHIKKQVLDQLKEYAEEQWIS